MKSFLTTTAMAVGVFSFTSSIALADCAPNSLSTGETTTCLGADPNGFKDGSDNIVVNVELSAVVSQETAGESTIDVSGDGVKVFNQGEILQSLTENTKSAVRGGENFSLENFGRIESTGDAVSFLSGNISNFGLIESTAPDGAAIRIGANSTGPVSIINSITIIGDNAVLVDPENTQSQTFLNSGGVNGIVNLGKGNDRIHNLGFFYNDILLGSGNDQFELDIFYPTLADGLTVNAGDGVDYLKIFSIAEIDLFSFGADLELFALGATAKFTGFETIEIDGFKTPGIFSMDNFLTTLPVSPRFMPQSPVAPVPLPAGIFLLGGALGALALRRRG